MDWTAVIEIDRRRKMRVLDRMKPQPSVNQREFAIHKPVGNHQLDALINQDQPPDRKNP